MPTSRTIVIIPLLLSSLCLTAGLAAPEHSDTESITFEGLQQFPEINDNSRRDIFIALGKSGHNRRELLQAIYRAPDSRTRTDVIFLISNMPERDLMTLSADFLLENTKQAEKARNEFSWCRNLPQDIFLNEVLPYASLNERRDNWRADFYSRFAPLVADATNITQAIKIINNRIPEITKVKYSTKRKKADQSPYESMESGLASCTGLSILLCDAFRSVGIPSRVAGTPQWTTKPGNHNWVEVMINGQWHFTEYYPTKEGLDHSWFLKDAGQADPQNLMHRIYASSFATTFNWFPLVWDLRIRFVYAEDVTGRYLELYRRQQEPVAPGQTLQVVLYGNNETNRIARSITLKRDGNIVASGTTAGPQDDMNKILELPISKPGSYTLEWTAPDGTLITKPIKISTANPVIQIKLSESSRK